MNPEKSEPEIKVTDRRRFSSEGEPLEAAEAEQESAADAEGGESLGESMPLPPPTFEFLALSLRWQAELQLGLYQTEKQPERRPDLEGARHSIDLLGMLQEKTRGNLSLEEQRLLENSLTELRFRYVQAVDKFAQKK